MNVITMRIPNPQQIFKKFQKHRSRQVWHQDYLVFGCAGFCLYRTSIWPMKKLLRIILFLKWLTPRRDKTLKTYWCKALLNYPISRKNLNSRMGKGKGKIKVWASQIRSGVIIFETLRVRRGRLKFYIKQIIHRIPNEGFIVNNSDIFAPLPLSKNLTRSRF
jgi:hypothetical protein